MLSAKHNSQHNSIMERAMGLISLLLDVTSFRDVPFANHMKVEYLGNFITFWKGLGLISWHFGLTNCCKGNVETSKISFILPNCIDTRKK